MPSTVKTKCEDEEKNIKIFLIKIYIYYLQYLYIYKKLENGNIEHDRKPIEHLDCNEEN